MFASLAWVTSFTIIIFSSPFNFSCKIHNLIFFCMAEYNSIVYMYCVYVLCIRICIVYMYMYCVYVYVYVYIFVHW